MSNSALKNDTRREDFLKEVAAWGRDHAAGQDSFPKVFAATVKGSQEGFLTLDRDSDGIDDAHRVYDRFGKADAKRIFADKKQQSDGSYKGQVSKMRTGIKMGQLNSKGIDSYHVISEAARIHKERASQGLNVKGAYTALVDVARAQLGSDTQLSDEQIVAAITPKDGAEKTVETVLRGIHRSLERLITGEAGVPFDCADDVKAGIVNMEETARGLLALVVTRREHADKAAKLAELAAELGVGITTPEQVAA